MAGADLAETDLVDELRSSATPRQVSAPCLHLLHHTLLLFWDSYFILFLWQCSWHWLSITSQRIFWWARGWNVCLEWCFGSPLFWGGTATIACGLERHAATARFFFCSQWEGNLTSSGSSLQCVLQTLFRCFIPFAILVSPRKSFITNSICSENCFAFKQPKPVGWEATSKRSSICAGSGNSVLAGLFSWPARLLLYLAWLKALTIEISISKMFVNKAINLKRGSSFIYWEHC